MEKLKVLDLFSGIGGFSLGLERTGGFETVAFCEIEKYPQKVLAKHWPGVPIYEDVKELTKKQLDTDGITGIDVITGGFPCQDLSVAGKQEGIEAGRSGLWSELCRIISDIRPRYAIVENVTALISGDNGRWFGKFLETWPRSGMTVNGTAYRLQNSARTITEIGSGLLPTPGARDGKDLSTTTAYLAARERHTPSLATVLLKAGLHWTLISNAYEKIMGFPFNHTEIDLKD